MSKRERTASSDNVLRHPSTKRAKEIDSESPLTELYDAIEKQKHDQPIRNVLHWFRSKDLRIEDNRGLHAASEKVSEGEKGSANLIGLYLHSPEDLEWHGTSPARTDFILETLKQMRKQLADKNIPLAFITAEKRSDKIDKVLDFIKDNDVSHVYANYEYEVDELHRDLKLAHRLADDSENKTTFALCHDQTVIEPGTMTSGSGGPLKVFTPYHKAWLAELGKDASYLDTVADPAANDSSAKSALKSLFSSEVPPLPDSKDFPNAERDRLRKLWPTGNRAAMKRLADFLGGDVKDYATTRSNPAADTSSRLSAYFSAGVVSVRQVLAEARKANNNKNLDASGGAGIAAWVREIVFREFYRQVLTTVPHESMNLPQNLKFDFVQWEDDEEGWEKWKNGTTGVPFVDAGMRQLNHEAWMHNRLRMNTASYLRTNLLIDYRRGERYFAEKLIDWDLANNTQGWEPSYTVFNPVSQAEKNDPEGDYIRRWVPELKDVKGKAVFSPHDRLSKAEFEKLGYPKPHVDWAESKKRCMERYKNDMADVHP